MTEPAHWQVQEAKQRFSEMLRAAVRDGPQTITKHGEDVAVVVDIAYFKELTVTEKTFKDHLLGPPYFDDDVMEIFDEIEAERKKDFPREIDLGIDA